MVLRGSSVTNMPTSAWFDVLGHDEQPLFIDVHSHHFTPVAYLLDVRFGFVHVVPLHLAIHSI